MAQEKPSWEEYFMCLAFGGSMRSKDPKTQVGCVIVDSKTLKILSIGYNGFTPGISNSVKNWSDDEKNDLVVHAEANAVLLKGGANLEGSIAFVTLFPCEDCAEYLIQAGVRKVYYLSFRDKYSGSEVKFKKAGVEIVPFKRERDCQLTIFQNKFIEMLKGAWVNVPHIDAEWYESLRKETDEFRKSDIPSPWGTESLEDQSAENRSDQVLFRKWVDYYLFLALIASTRSPSETESEGALLIDSKTFKICSLSYKGYLRGVEDNPGEKMMVSAIVNVLSLRFCEGNHFYAFSTHFPSLNKVKDLAQAKVKRLYFISPGNVNGRALKTLEAAEVKVVPMNLLELGKVEEEVKQTIEGLAKKEAANTTSFNSWPKNQWTPYKLIPERRYTMPRIGRFLFYSSVTIISVPIIAALVPRLLQVLHNLIPTSAC